MKINTMTGLFLLLLIGMPICSEAYEPWAEAVFEHVEKEYGKQAEKRMRYLQNLIIENQNLSVSEKLELVNVKANNLPWVADKMHWKEVDYWASPLQTIATFGGDCEDIAIVKWMVLNHLGIGNDHLRLAVVKVKRGGESHMVLLYISNPEAPLAEQSVLVLDNNTDKILKAKERTDLFGILVIDVHGNLTLISDDGQKRSIKGEYPNRKLKPLVELKKKIAQERDTYTKLNGGRPLLPEGR